MTKTYRHSRNRPIDPLSIAVAIFGLALVMFAVDASIAHRVAILPGGEVGIVDRPMGDRPRDSVVVRVTDGADGPGPSAVHRDATGAPARWEPCTPIVWRWSGADGMQLGGIRIAFDAIAAATGLTFVEGEPIAVEPHVDSKVQPPSGAIVIAIVDRVEGAFPDRAVGMASPWVRLVPGAPRITGAIIRLDRSFIDRRPDLLIDVVEHEVGHAVGLGHVDDPTQIMNASASNDPIPLGSGDLLGLAVVGRQPGECPAA